MAVANVPDEPEEGGYEYEFVDKVHERYFCSIVCHKVLRDARLLVCCGNHICESCLNRWLRSQGKRGEQTEPLCPHCREENFTHVKNLSLRREVDDLKIRCTNSKQGCTRVGALSDLKTHLESEKGCGFVEVHCTNKCKKQLKRQDLADHLTQHCPLRKCKCQHCGKEDTYQTITEKHYDECPSYPLDCPNKCGAREIKRAEMDQHRSECPLEAVECPFKEAGCQAKPARNELDSHMTANQQQHILKLMAAFNAAKEATRVLQEVIATDGVIVRPGAVKQSANLAVASITSQLEKGSFCLQCDGPPLTVRMINFSHYRQSGKVWRTPPFYCDPGYKMQLAVYANGIGAGASTHVSVALQLMKGEFDHQLRWPFQGLDLQLCIVSQKATSKERLVSARLSVCHICTPADRVQRVLEREGVREVGKMLKFADYRTLRYKGLVTNSIVLEIGVIGHKCPPVSHFAVLKKSGLIAHS